jgi:hypothetical protein
MAHLGVGDRLEDSKAYGASQHGQAEEGRYTALLHLFQHKYLDLQISKASSSAYCSLCVKKYINDFGSYSAYN